MSARNGFIIAMTALVLSASAMEIQDRYVNDYFDIRFGPSGIAGLKRSFQPDEMNFILRERVLGDIFLRYRMLDLEWQDFDTTRLSDLYTIKQESGASSNQRIFVYNGSGWYDYYTDLEFTSRLRLEGDTLYWTLHLRNVTHKPIEIEQFYLPLPLGNNRDLKRNVYLTGNGYVTWKGSEEKGLFLILTPLSKCPLFEPAQTERNFTSAALVDADESGIFLFSSQKMPPSANLILTPKFTPGDEITYGFSFRWADRDQIY